MSLPAGWRLVPVTGRFIGVSGVPCVGKVAFRSKQRVVIDGAVIVPDVITATLDVDGMVNAQLPATDDPALSVTGWGYTVLERFVGGGDAYVLPVPYNSDGIDLSTAIRLIAPPYLVSNQGPSGNTLFATFGIDLQTGELSVTTPDAYDGPSFAIDDNGTLGVTIG